MIESTDGSRRSVVNWLDALIALRNDVKLSVLRRFRITKSDENFTDVDVGDFLTHKSNSNPLSARRALM